MPRAVPRLTWWTRAQALSWIMERRLPAVAEAPPYVPSRRDRSGASPMVWVVKDTLRRMHAAPAARRLPRFADADIALAKAEQNGLTPDSSGHFRGEEIKRRWPSPYGRATSRSGAPSGGGVAPRPWDDLIIRKLAGKFMRKRRDRTRDELRTWTGKVPFNDPERWTAYVRRAMAAAIIDILLRRQCRCPDDSAAKRCIKAHGRRFCLTRDEGAAMLANVWSWRADGPLPPRG
jgi:hypothetical protein